MAKLMMATLAIFLFTMIPAHAADPTVQVNQVSADCNALIAQHRLSPFANPAGYAFSALSTYKNTRNPNHVADALNWVVAGKNFVSTQAGYGHIDAAAAAELQADFDAVAAQILAP